MGISFHKERTTKLQLFTPMFGSKTLLRWKPLCSGSRPVAEVGIAEAETKI